MDMNQYLDMFIEESKEHLQAINANLLVLENDPESTQIVNEIFRSAHTLKGMSATMGFEDMASLTHEAENVLDLIRNDKLKINSDIMDVIFQSVDLIEGMVMNIMEGGDGSADVSQPVAKLRAIVSGDFSAIANVAAQEATASVEQVAAGGSEDGNREYDLDEFSLTVLKQSKEAGNNLFWIKVTLQENCLLKAARAYMVFDQLESMGEVIKSTPAVEDLENERFDLSFEVVFVTMEPLEKVKKAIGNISEIEEVLVEPVEMKEAGKQAKQAEQQVAAAAAAPAEVKKAEGPAQNNTAVKK